MRCTWWCMTANQCMGLMQRNDLYEDSNRYPLLVQCYKLRCYHLLKPALDISERGMGFSHNGFTVSLIGLWFLKCLHSSVEVGIALVMMMVTCCIWVIFNGLFDCQWHYDCPIVSSCNFKHHMQSERALCEHQFCVCGIISSSVTTPHCMSRPRLLCYAYCELYY